MREDKSKNCTILLSDSKQWSNEDKARVKI